MRPDLSNAVILFGGGLALLLGLGQLLNPRRNARSVFIFIIFSSIAVFQIQQFFSLVSNGPYVNTELHGLLLAEYLIGPSMYLFYMSLFHKGYSLRLRTFTHFIPAGVALILIIILKIHHKITGHFLNSLYHFIIRGEIPYYFYLMGIALIVGYILAILSKMEILSVIKDRNRQMSRMNIIALTTILILASIMLLMIIAMVTHAEVFARISLSFTSFFVIYWFMASQINPAVFSGTPAKKRKDDSVAAELSDEEKKKISEGLAVLMESEKLYCDEDLTLNRLANNLDCTTQQLSAFLNRELKMNFNSYINRYRIEEAISLMKEDDSRSLLEIAFSVGFNSKSVFYDAFSKTAGISPAKFRKQLKKKNSPD